MKIKGKRILKNGTVAGYVYYPKEKKWKWRFIKKTHKKGGIPNSLNNCDLNIVKNFNNISESLRIFDTNNFKLSYSHVGGILDIRPNNNKIKNKIINKNAFNINSDIGSFYYDHNISSCYPKALIILISAFNNILQQKINNGCLIITISDNYNDFEISYNYKDTNTKYETITIYIEYPDLDYGHYALCITNKENKNAYYFDPLGNQNNNTDYYDNILYESLIKILPDYKILNIYKLNLSCFRTMYHQDIETSFCSIWITYLIFLINLNNNRDILDIFKYFGYKAKTPEYLLEKIRLFTLYITELENKMGNNLSLDISYNFNIYEKMYLNPNGKILRKNKMSSRNYKYKKNKCLSFGCKIKQMKKGKIKCVCNNNIY